MKTIIKNKIEWVQKRLSLIGKQLDEQQIEYLSLAFSEIGKELPTKELSEITDEDAEQVGRLSDLLSSIEYLPHDYKVHGRHYITGDIDAFNVPIFRYLFLKGYNVGLSIPPHSGEKAINESLLKKAFETFQYVPFPHNNPTWEEFIKENNLSNMTDKESNLEFKNTLIKFYEMLEKEGKFPNARGYAKFWADRFFEQTKNE